MYIHPLIRLFLHSFVGFDRLQWKSLNYTDKCKKMANVQKKNKINRKIENQKWHVKIVKRLVQTKLKLNPFTTHPDVSGGSGDKFTLTTPSPKSWIF